MNLFNVALLFFAVSTVNCAYEKVNCDSTGVPCWPWEYCKYVMTGSSIATPTCETSADIPINQKQNDKCFLHPDPYITATYVSGTTIWPVPCYFPWTGPMTTPAPTPAPTTIGHGGKSKGGWWLVVRGKGGWWQRQRQNLRERCSINDLCHLCCPPPFQYF